MALGIGAYFVDHLLGRFSVKTRNVIYRFQILLLTFLCYTCYHMVKKPPSVVKNVLHDVNCTINGEQVYNVSLCSWPPFDGSNYNSLLGILDYAFLFTYAIGMFFSGHIAERVNLRYFLSSGMILCGLATAAFGLGFFTNIHAFWYYVLIQVLSGLVNCTGWPSVVTCVANWFGKGKRGFIMGVWNSHTSIGNILGSLIAGIFVTEVWGLSFIVPGAIMAGLGLIVFFFLVPDPRDVKLESPYPSPGLLDEESRMRVDKKESDPLLDEVNPSGYSRILQNPQEIGNYASISHSNDEEPQDEHAISIWRALKIPGVVEFSLCLFFAKLVSYTFLYWLPNYIKNTNKKLSSGSAADLSTFFDVGGIFGGIVAGTISDYTGGSATTCVAMLLIAAPMMFIYESYGSVNLTNCIVLLLVTGAFVNGPYALITTAVSANLGTHPSLQGNSKALATVTAIIDGTGSFGAALGPLLTGIISDSSSWKDVFWMLIAATVAAMLLLTRQVVKEIRSWVNKRPQP